MPATPPDPTVVLDLLDAFRRSKVMFVAVSLGVFDKLAAGPTTAPALAEALPANVDALSRLLDACVSLKLLTCDAGRYANTSAASAYLTTTSPTRLTGYVGYSDAVLWKLWAHLDDAVREGTHRWPQAFGQSGPIFKALFRTDHDLREFLMGMHGLGQLSSPAVAAAFDLSRFRRLADIGGATGHLAVAACRCYPTLRAVVFDLPGAIPLARELLAETEVQDRVELVAGDFFADPLPEADLYTLGRILHDWHEDKIHRLLAKIYAQLPRGGALLVAEKLLDTEGGALSPRLQSLNMLLVTEGKERTLAEYETILRAAGFSRVEARRTTAPLDAILACKD